MTQVFSYEFCEISKNTFFHRTPPVAASAVRNNDVAHTNIFLKKKKKKKKKSSKLKAAISSNFLKCLSHKQPSKGVLRKMCSKNMQQIYSRTTMAKCDFNKAIKAMQSNFIETSLCVGRSLVNSLHIFRTPFPKKTSGGLLLLSLI